ncbi:hypothetical protein COCMIDRAFT_93184 [Bipolaris oryzae ATCC 44560]|uniref:Uncharacterized protein n=1 Tax=Bipolaris oryzae ATCC 44560 TaxID=930090 RepID=W6Z966_COCMI|nr:uncharacterized protein COCMIDRAFT_93184 [Bipolaris oryzae ATCC 44560]EUC46308.1 hypothetical protein COCMIDRAFT_93184 [Bipolaris oryzae ATCC 44560]
MAQTMPAAPPEDVAHDHLCPICQLLLYTPVKTQCNHLLCASCMAQWADASSTNQIEHSSLDVHLADFDPNYDPSYDLEANCPMCRTHTTASPDKPLARQLEAMYPVTYAERRVEEEVDRGSRIGQDGVEGVMILIGNKHRLIRNPVSANEHLWTFFVRTSRPELIKEVHIYLHPTFRPSHHVLRTAPYEFEAQGWGFFTIESKIVLKAPYNWIIDNAGTKKQGLELSWTLDFEGRGRQGRVRAKVKKFEAETAPAGRTLRSRHIPPTTEPEVDNSNEDGDEDSSEDNVEDEGDSEFIVPSRRSRR